MFHVRRADPPDYGFTMKHVIILLAILNIAAFGSAQQPAATDATEVLLNKRAIRRWSLKNRTMLPPPKQNHQPLHTEEHNNNLAGTPMLSARK